MMTDPPITNRGGTAVNVCCGAALQYAALVEIYEIMRAAAFERRIETVVASAIVELGVTALINDPLARRDNPSPTRAHSTRRSTKQWARTMPSAQRFRWQGYESLLRR
jgi:hypothetical protein